MKVHTQSLFAVVSGVALTLALIPASAYAQSMPLNGPYGVLLQTSVTNPATDGGGAVLTMMKFDGAGNITGSYDLEVGGTDAQAGQSVTGTLTGTYSTNPDGTGTAAVALDIGATFNFAMVVGDGGQSLQLLVTSCGGGCNLAGEVTSGFGRAAYSGPLQGSYAARLNNYPNPQGVIALTSFDGAGNVATSSTVVGASQDPNTPPSVTQNLTGSYSANPDGSGTISFGDNGTYVYVMVAGGAEVLLLQTGRGKNVQFGIARRQ